MEKTIRNVSRIAFGLLCAVLLASPWCFGAWEAWWFWPFVTVLFGAGAFFGLQLLMESLQQESHPVSGGRSLTTPSRRWRHGCTVQRRHGIVLLSYLSFLLYAAFQMMRAPVFADAQRSFLLFATSGLVTLQIVYGLDRPQRRILFRLLLLNLALLALYGIINHAVCSSRLVLWRPGFEQYFTAGRASGSYFCPDHYAGILEMALCLSAGLLCVRGTRRGMRLAALFITALSLTGIVLSKSRGAGLTVIVIFGGIWLWGLRHARPRLRWSLRVTLPLIGVLLIGAAAMAGHGYFKRFGAWFGWERAREQPFAEAVDTIAQSVQRTSRWVMLSGAIQAWRESPVWGIGPGMHQNVWPHVAASDDGDRAGRVWPSRLNNTHYSYEVHNDWAQLLEEYGLAGLILFLIPTVALAGALLHGMRSSYIAPSDTPLPSGHAEASALLLGAWLTLLALAFHSLGDFNLQMPATTWIFAAIIALGIRSGSSMALHPKARKRRRSVRA